MPPLGSPPVAFTSSADQSSTSGLLLGIDWPSPLHALPFQDGGLQGDYVDQRNDRSHSSILSDFILLNEGMGERMDSNLTLISADQSEISIDPELLTLKPVVHHEPETS